METDTNTMIAMILLALGVAGLLFVTLDDDDSDNDDSSGEPAETETEQGNPGFVEPGGDGIPSITPGNPDGDNSIGNGSGSFNLSASQRFFLGAGDDSAFAGGGNDTVFGGSGDDFLNGSTGNDSLFGSHGNDTVIGGFGDDNMFLGFGEDVVISDDLDTALAQVLTSANVTDADPAMEALQTNMYSEMGGDDNILGGESAQTQQQSDMLDSGDTIIDLIGSNSINGAVGNDVIFAFDRDSSEDGIAPEGDTINGGYNKDEIWADDGDTVTLDPAESSGHQVSDHLVIANALSGRGEVADSADEAVNANDYVTVTDFDPSKDVVTVLTSDFAESEFTFVQDGDNVQMVADGSEILAVFQNTTVAEFEDFVPTVSSTVNA